MPPRVVALISTFNEGDILAEVLEYLCDEGVCPYVIDDGSTDRTRAILDAFAGRGLIEYEVRDTDHDVFRWTDILRRKETLASQLGADWFIHHDADEFRESPWSGLTLAEAIGLVDASGFNAIDFALMDFWPLKGGADETVDVRRRLTHFGPADEWNRRQIKCWKNESQCVDLVSSGGHEVDIRGRRVFPLRFILRHYPIRSEEHGRRKVFEDRLPRFDAAERARGWHVQYDRLQSTGFERDRETLTRFDGVRTRAALAVEDAMSLDASRLEAETEAARLAGMLEAETTRRNAVELALRTEVALERELRASDVRALQERLVIAATQLSDAHQELIRLSTQVEAFRTSKTWRWTQPLRGLINTLHGRRRNG